MPIKETALKVSFGKLPGHASTLRDLPLSRNCVGAADVALFNRIVTNVHHPLQGFLPSRLSRPYNMRPREHEFQLPDKQNSIHERNFLIRIFYLA